MKRILLACALFLSVFCAQAYNLKATVSLEKKSKWRFDIEIENNNQDFTAFQLDITLDGEAKLKSGNLTADSLMRHHSLNLSGKDGKYHVSGFNMGSRVLRGKEGRLFSFTIEGKVDSIAIDNVFFVRTDGSKVKPYIYTNTAEGDKKTNASQKEREVVFMKKGTQAYKIDYRGICIRKGKK